MAITDWPENERPREKLLTHGACALSDAELLAIFLRTGIQGQSAVDMGRGLITQFGSLNRLFSASKMDFCAIRGMGSAKYAQLQAVLEMSRRALAETMRHGDAMKSPGAVRDFLRLNLASREHEVFCAVFLDTQHRVLAVEELFRGTLSQASVYPREVVKRALAHNAAALILAHNHPSGVAEPSMADQNLTSALKNALALVDIRVLDHFVITQDLVLSFAERGLL